MRHEACRCRRMVEYLVHGIISLDGTDCNSSSFRVTGLHNNWYKREKKKAGQLFFCGCNSSSILSHILWYPGIQYVQAYVT